MLVLTRKKNESLMIGDNIEIVVVDIQGEQVRIGINAPRSVPVHRKEVFEEIAEANRAAMVQGAGIDALLNAVKKQKE
ncbi:MAG: carbon storage regulator CsrA [Solirubrobacterales bacterium]